MLSSFATVGRVLGLETEGAALEATSRTRLGRLPGGLPDVAGPGSFTAAGGSGGAGVAGAGGRGGADVAGAGGSGRAGIPAIARHRVVVLDWVDPPFVAGNWVPDLVRIAGGGPLLAQPGAPSRESSIAEISSCGADVIVVAPCGLDLDAAQLGAQALLTTLHDHAEVSAGAGAILAGLTRPLPRIVAFDGRIWFSRPGPRLVEGAEALAAWLTGLAPDGDVTSIEITEAEW